MYATDKKIMELPSAIVSRGDNRETLPGRASRVSGTWRSAGRRARAKVDGPKVRDLMPSPLVRAFILTSDRQIKLNDTRSR